MKQFQPKLDGIELLQADKHITDQRGAFIKFIGERSWAEDFFTVSHQDVIRGMHFHPGQDKLVWVSSGRIVDVVVDLRPESKTFGDHSIVQLTPGIALRVPDGFAHGFYSQANETVVNYRTSTPYRAELDLGVRWDSCGIDWPFRGDWIISGRDLQLQTLDEFKRASGRTPCKLLNSSEAPR